MIGPMMAIDIGPMIDRGLDDNCGPILASYISPKITPDDRPRVRVRVKPMIFFMMILIMTIKFKT